MNGSPALLTRLVVRLFSLSLRLYPEPMRNEYADEMNAVFSFKAAEAAQQGAGELLTLACREGRDLPRAVLAAHLQVERGPMNPKFPATSDQAPWGTALLSLLPFFLAGPVHLVLFFQGWPQRGEPAWYYVPFLVLTALAIALGLIVGAIKRFPRWAYLYPISLVLALSDFWTTAGYLYDWKLKEMNFNFLLLLAVVLLLFCLPGLRTFYRGISADWTLASYCLYGLVRFLLAGVDRDETPVLNLQVLLPSLIILAGALAHLRIRPADRRIYALLAATAAACFFWWLPVFNGMNGSLAAMGVWLFYFLVFIICFGALLLVPLLVRSAVDAWRSKRAVR